MTTTQQQHRTIKTHGQASIRTTVTDSNGNTRSAVLTTKQALFNKMRSFQWVPIAPLTRTVSRSGIRRALTEMRQWGYGIESRYNPSNGALSSVRLVSLPGIGASFRGNSS